MPTHAYIPIEQDSRTGASRNICGRGEPSTRQGGCQTGASGTFPHRAPELPPAKGALRPLPRTDGQLRPQSYAGTSQLRPAYLCVPGHSSALFQGRHRTLPFERSSALAVVAGGSVALRRPECFDSRSSGVSCTSSGPILSRPPPIPATPAPALSPTAVPE